MEKRINIFNKETRVMMRVTHSLADTLSEQHPGQITHTSKGALKRALNKQRKMGVNNEAIKPYDFSEGNKNNNKIFKDNSNGKTVARYLIGKKWKNYTFRILVYPSKN